MEQKITRKRWTDTEMEFARQLYTCGVPKDEIAERLGRTKKSIEVRISLKKDFFEGPQIVVKPDVEYRPTLWERLQRLFA